MASIMKQQAMAGQQQLNNAVEAALAQLMQRVEVLEAKVKALEDPFAKIRRAKP